MKKLLILSFMICLLFVTSCFGEQGVQGKSFIYESLVESEVKEGTQTDFYSDKNFAGSTQEAVVSAVVNKLYSHGTSTRCDELSFSSGPVSGFKYNGSAVTVYNFNYEETDETNATSEGYYINLNSDFTSIKFLKEDSASFDLNDFVFSCGGESSSSKKNDVKVVTKTSTTFVVNSATYDPSTNKLTIKAEVTFIYQVNDDIETNVMDYTLLFKER